VSLRKRIGQREAYWPALGAFAEAAVFDEAVLRPGNVIQGPALIESPFTTIVITPDRQYRIDEHGLGFIEPTRR